ncbi:hypothetical protein K0M31_002996, partial [Melipona bicolor]
RETPAQKEEGRKLGPSCAQFSSEREEELVPFPATNRSTERFWRRRRRPLSLRGKILEIPDRLNAAVDSAVRTKAIIARGNEKTTLQISVKRCTDEIESHDYTVNCVAPLATFVFLKHTSIRTSRSNSFSD